VYTFITDSQYITFDEVTIYPTSRNRIYSVPIELRFYPQALKAICLR